MQLRTSADTPAEEHPPDGECCQSVERATWRRPAVDRSVGRLRHAVRVALREWGLDEISDVTELCVSELVTNSVIHSKDPSSTVTLNVTVDRERGRLRISVADRSTSAPQVREPMSDDEHGRGLLLVRALAAGWGVDHAPARNGKVVWCEIETG